MPKTAVAVANALCLASLVACQKPAEPTRVENPSLGVAIAHLPDGFSVLANEDQRLELSHGEARFFVELGSQERGVNLVEAIRLQPAQFESLPGGSYLGNTELMTPIGSAYSARGRYLEGEREVEETRILSLHPWGDRQLILRYLYPASDDSKERVGELVGVLGEIEGVGTPPP